MGAGLARDDVVSGYELPADVMLSQASQLPHWSSSVFEISLFFAAFGTPVTHGLEELFIDLVGIQQHPADLA